MKLSGWKSKTGFILLILGIIMKGTASSFPDLSSLNEVGEALYKSGMGLLGIGIAHKIEKNK